MNLCAVDGAVESDAEFDTEALTTVEHCIEVEQPRRVQCRWFLASVDFFMVLVLKNQSIGECDITF